MQTKERLARRRQPALRLKSLSISLALNVSATARAADDQAAEPEKTLPAISVTERAIPSSEGYTAPDVSVGMRLPATSRQIPQSVSVLTQQQLDDQNLQSLDQALANAPGITVQQQTTVDSYFYSRGFQINQIQLDGVPQESPFASSFQPDLAIYERVEILRGAAGLMTGAGQPGGLVNLVRKRPQKDYQFNFTQSAGSWNNYRTVVDTTGSLNHAGTLRGRLISTYQNRDYFSDELYSKRSQIYGLVEADLAPATLLTLGFGYQDFKSLSDTFGLPRYSNGADLQLRRSSFLGTAWGHYNFTAQDAFAEIRHRFDPDWELKATFNRRKAQSDLFSGYVLGPVNPTPRSGATLNGSAYGYDEKQTGLDLNLTGAFTAFGRRHSIIAGVDGYNKETQTDAAGRIYTTTIPVNAFQFYPGGYAMPARPAVANSSYADIRQRGLYAAARLRITEPMTVLLGGRFSWYDNARKNLLTGRITSSYKQDGRFTPYAGVIYDINSQWSAYTSYTDIFQPQSQITYAGSQLSPAIGTNLEAGIKGELADRALNASFAIFRIKQKNRAQPDPAHPGATDCGGAACYVAEGLVRSQGFDAELTGRLRPDWNISAGYTFNTTRYLKDRTTSGNASANEGLAFSTYTPKHMLRLWTTYQLPGQLRQWEVGGGVNFQSENYRAYGNTRLNQPAYAIWNVQLNYRIDPRWSLAINLNNLFDKRYYAALGNVALRNFYGEPRNVMLTLRGNFK